MKSRNLLLTTVLTAAVLGLFAAVLASSLLPGHASAGQILTGHLSGSQHGHGRWHAHASCDADEAQLVALANAWVSITLNLDESQETALVPVLDVLARWHDDARVLCDHPDVADAPAALAMLDTLIEDSALAMNDLVPAFNAFYASLTAEQQASLNAWIKARHGT